MGYQVLRLSRGPAGIRSATGVCQRGRWTVSVGFFMGWLAAPLTHLLFWFWLCFLERRKSWPGGFVKVCHPYGVNLALGRHAFIERLLEELN